MVWMRSGLESRPSGQDSETGPLSVQWQKAPNADDKWIGDNTLAFENVMITRIVISGGLELDDRRR